MCDRADEMSTAALAAADDWQHSNAPTANPRHRDAPFAAALRPRQLTTAFDLATEHPVRRRSRVTYVISFESHRSHAGIRAARRSRKIHQNASLRREIPKGGILVR